MGDARPGRLSYETAQGRVIVIEAFELLIAVAAVYFIASAGVEMWRTR